MIDCLSWGHGRAVLWMPDGRHDNGMKLAAGVGILQRPLFWVMIVAMLVSLVSSLGVILRTCHEEGAANLEPWFFTHNARNTILCGPEHCGRGSAAWGWPS